MGPQQRRLAPGRSAFIYAGAPLLLFVVGGSWLLSTFTAGQFEARDLRVKSLSFRAFNVAEEHDKMAKKLADEGTDDYIIKKIVRPDD